MSNDAQVVSVNISTEKGTIKEPVESIEIDDRGIVGDAHAGRWHRQVSLLSSESIDRFSKKMKRDFKPGVFAENVTTTGIDLSSVRLLDRLRVGEVELEVTQIGKECHGDGCAIYREVGKCVMPTDGIFCRVLQTGSIRPGDRVELFARTWKFRVITLSDRAHRGEYPDRSGPKIAEMIGEFAGKKTWKTDIQTAVLPDDADRLLAELSAAGNDGVDVVFTTGGTGVGPRDITPDVVSSFCEKTIPGIMEAIRVKYGAAKPNALLSRSVAGVAGQMLVFALPGSLKAVAEYMTEIEKTLEHLLLMLHGLDAH
jgi:molybdenum cofactor synthesis domain-containing protein